MNITDISLSSVRVKNGDYRLDVHGSILTDDQAVVDIEKIDPGIIKDKVLRLKLNLETIDPNNTIVAKPFLYRETGSGAEKYEQVELVYSTDDPLVVDIIDINNYNSGESMEDTSFVDDGQKQNISEIELRLKRVGSLAVMSKKGSKKKDRRN